MRVTVFGRQKNYSSMDNLTAGLKLLITEYSIRYKIDCVYLLALIKTESEFNPLAQRFELGYPYLYSVRELAEIVGCSRSTMEFAQKNSYGLCQIMGAVAYEGGFRAWPAKLFDPEINLKYACEYIIKLNKRFDLVEHEEMYAAYNAGRPRKIDKNIWVNQSAVGRFMKQLDIIKSMDLL